MPCTYAWPFFFFWCLQLPDRYSAPWRLVFSTCLHGESFTRMVGGLMKHGPTLLLIKDTKGHIFGGFASHGWEVKPQFQGKFNKEAELEMDTCVTHVQKKQRKLFHSKGLSQISRSGSKYQKSTLLLSVFAFFA